MRFDDATQQRDPLDLESTPLSLQTISPVYQSTGVAYWTVPLQRAFMTIFPTFSSQPPSSVPLVIHP